jgi:hypothetical protein
MLKMIQGLCLGCIFITGFLVASEPENKSTQRIFQFENEHVRVWRTIIMPNQPLKMHRHDCARVLVSLKGGDLKKLEESGEIKSRIFETGKAYWLDQDPPVELHACVNDSDEPIDVMVIELKQ